MHTASRKFLLLALMINLFFVAATLRPTPTYASEIGSDASSMPTMESGGSLEEPFGVPPTQEADLQNPTQSDESSMQAPDDAAQQAPNGNEASGSGSQTSESQPSSKQSQLSAQGTSSATSEEKTNSSKLTNSDKGKELVTSSDKDAPLPAPKLSGRAYVQRKGWLPWNTDVEVGKVITIGTTGQSLRLEALCIKVDGDGLAGSVSYQAHVQRLGWTDTRTNGSVAGTLGRSLRLEALRVALTGDIASSYDLWYRVHVSGVGWLGWTNGNRNAGSTGFSKRVEAIQLVMRKKGDPEPMQTGAYALPCVSYQSGKVGYASFVKGAWQGYVKPAKVSGTTGKATPVRGIRANCSNTDGLPGTVEYCAHVSKVGWTGWAQNGVTAGNGRNNVEAVRFRLTGTLSKLYDIWYRAHVSSAGWLGWAKNGAAAGSTGASKKLEAYQIRLLPKGHAAPGSTKNACVGKYYFLDGMTRRALNYSSGTGYLVMVDNGSSHVGIYTGHYGSWNRIKYWSASMGKSSTPTVRGTYSIGAKGYVFGDGYSCYYWTSFYNDYLFHSVLYHEGTRDIMDGTLGYNVSHGCVRLAIENAKWLQDNVPYGTTVVSY